MVFVGRRGGVKEADVTGRRHEFAGATSRKVSD
jgi:hypothetical protein